MPSYQSVIANRIPELAIGFDDLKCREIHPSYGQPFEFSYTSDRDVIARLHIEIKDRPYQKYFVPVDFVLAAINNPLEESYYGFYLTYTKQFILFNISKCKKKVVKMSAVFPGYKGKIDRSIYAIDHEDSCLDMVMTI